MTGNAACVEACREFFRNAIQQEHAKHGQGPCDVHITTEPPLIRQQHEVIAMSCPHGVTFYAVPTTEQIAAWAEAGVE